MPWVGVDATADGVRVGAEEVDGSFGDVNTVNGDDAVRDVVVAGEEVEKKGGWCGCEEGKRKNPAGAVGDPGPAGVEASVEGNPSVAAGVEAQMSCDARSMEVDPKADLMDVVVEARVHAWRVGKTDAHGRTDARHLVGAEGVDVGADEDGRGSVGRVDEDDEQGQADDSRCGDLFLYPAPCLSLGHGLFPGSLSVQIHHSFCGPVHGHEVAVVGDRPWVGPVPCLVLGLKRCGQDDASCLCPLSPFLSAFPFHSIPSPSVPFLSHDHSSPSLSH